MDIELATDPYACMMYIVSPLAGLGGGILWRPRVYSLFFFKIGLLFRSIRRFHHRSFNEHSGVDGGRFSQAVCPIHVNQPTVSDH